MSPYERQLIQLCYNHFRKTGSKEFTYQTKNGTDMIFTTNAIESLEENGYIYDVIDNGFSLSFTIRDSLTRREQEIPHFYKWWDELR